MGATNTFHSVTTANLPASGTVGDIYFTTDRKLLYAVVGDGSLVQLLVSTPIPVQGPAGPKGDTGDTGALFTSTIQFSGDWSGVVEYAAGAIVNSNNFSWLCTTGNIGNSPSTSPYWQVLAPAAFSSRPFSLVCVCDGAGSVPSAGVKGNYVLPFAATITSWSLIADQVGSAEFDILASTFAAFPSGAQSIVNGNYPNLSAQQTSEGDPASWSTVTFAAGTVIEFSLLSASGVNFLTVTLNLKPSD